mgnify:CR=1 FL=1
MHLRSKYHASVQSDHNPGRHSGMLLAGIQKNFLDSGLEPAGMMDGNSDIHL